MQSSKSESDDDNWLNHAPVACATCGAVSWRIDHSPFCDDYRLYCGRCPRAVEVSLYDPAVMAAERDGEIPQEHDREDWMRWVEPRLSPCGCGGRFADHAPRRCFQCHAEVDIADPAGVDLYPMAWDALSDADERLWHEFADAWIRTDGIWRDESEVRVEAT